MKLTSILLSLAITWAASATASAGEFTVLKEEIVAARASLVTLVTDRQKRGPEQQKLVKDTADAVTARFAKLKAPQGKTAEFQELKTTWEAFKATREKDLVPAILANDTAKYTKLGAVIQKERLDRMYALIQIMEK
jgi:hypothetical protein